MSSDLTPVIAAGTRWLLTAFPPAPGAFSQALAEAQARQAVTVAATLRYPTPFDAQLLHLLGPGGSARLDWLTGADHGGDADAGWRTWVDETVVSWAACLLASPALAMDARHLVDRGQAGEITRLTRPGDHEHDAAPLLRHPDLLEPVAALHRELLLDLLDNDCAALG
ncbi:hypothetical protein [Streptomyces sp. WAC05950]|uniref:hypothetical protein n=1 Tax=Streptomyces sp. WAC05950 TaxID=2487419 RepID=UPI000F73C633|nr:hypothetical protein [Streptomyces sp. WAC05950]RST03721.1 hypothetical protein EF904_20565 [Streptomyces sp. WAC05950]